MRRTFFLSLLSPLALFLAFTGMGCIPGQLPLQGVTHAVSAADRTLLASAFVVEVSREKGIDMGLFDVYQSYFLYQYLDLCNIGDDLTNFLGEWPVGSVMVKECSTDSYTLEIWDDNHGERFLESIVVVARAETTLPAATHALRTAAILQDSRQGPALKPGSLYKIVTEIQAIPAPDGMVDAKILLREILQGTYLIFSLGTGSEYEISYLPGTSVTFDASRREMTVNANVRGPALGMSVVMPKDGKPICLPSEKMGGPAPGVYTVDIGGMATTVELISYNGVIELKTSNVFFGKDIKWYFNARPVKDGAPVSSGFLELNGKKIVDPENGVGSMSLVLELSNQQGEMLKSFFKFVTPMLTNTFPAVLSSSQQEPSLIGIALMMMNQ